MRAPAERAEAVFRSLARHGLETAELYMKHGRSRRVEVDLQGQSFGASVERGWAVRAGNPRASIFTAGTGLPSSEGDWPEPDGQSLRLPSPESIPDWKPPADLDLPLLGEKEAVTYMDSIGRAIQDELPGSRVLHGVLEEGSSETSLFNTLGVEAHFRRRAASLYLEVVGPWAGTPSCRLNLAERDYGSFQATAIAGRVANRLLLAREGTAPSRERGEILVGAPVAARLLVSLLPMLVGREGERLAQRIRDRQGRVGSRCLTIVDDGRWPNGVLATPVDGEGRPTGRRVLIDEGRFCTALLDWREQRSRAPAPIGCMRRESWRDLPLVGPSHLFIEPSPEASVRDLLGSITRGYYLVESLGPGAFDFQRDRFRLPVCGFELRQGRATAPLPRSWLEGGIRALLDGVRAVARDLTFEPLGAMVGAPSLLLEGVGLRQAESN